MNIIIKKILIYIYFLYRTLKWKKSVDDVAQFVDKKNIPCILAENKADLLESPNKDEDELKKFAQENGFDGVFRTSAKAGLNIEESMACLIEKIIQRMEAMQSQGTEVFNAERKVVSLDPEKHNEVTIKKKKNDGCC